MNNKSKLGKQKKTVKKGSKPDKTKIKTTREKCMKEEIL